MSQEQDQRIAKLLGADAPPARDPLFRVRVMELRERRQFRRRSVTMFAGAVVTVGIAIGSPALEGTAALVVLAALVSSWLAFRGRVLGILRRFRL